MSRSILLPIIKCIFSPRYSIEEDTDTLGLLTEIRLSERYQKYDYKKEKSPNMQFEYIIRSLNVDKCLRSFDMSIEEDHLLINRVNRALKSDFKNMITILRCKLRSSRHSDPQQRFFNESKVCLGNDILPYKNRLLVFKGSYFHSFLTNEIACLRLESRGPHPRIVFAGSKHFPLTHNKGGSIVLKDIEDSSMGNHIGISTLAHTSDNKIVLMRQ